MGSSPDAASIFARTAIRRAPWRGRVLCGPPIAEIAGREFFDAGARCGEVHPVFEFNLTVALFLVIALVLTLIVLGDSLGRKN